MAQQAKVVKVGPGGRNNGPRPKVENPGKVFKRILAYVMSRYKAQVIVVLCCILLAVVLTLTTWGARRLGFNKEDEITLVFCGSKKSMVSGIPMANVLFPAASVGAIVLPLMLFHQIQLMVCAVLAQRYARREEEVQDSDAAKAH